MKMKLLIYKSVLLIAAIGLMLSCKSEDGDLNPPTSKSNVYSELQKEADLSLFLEAVELAGMQSSLQQDGITLFAPNDSSLQFYLSRVLGVDSISGFYHFAGAETFQSFLSYHILQKKLKTMDVVNSYIATSAKNADGDYLHLYASSVNKNIFLNSYAGKVIEPDHEVEGSVIHKIEGVLTPLTLNGLIRVNPNLSKMRTAISTSQDNLETLLNQENQMNTIFCPNDVAISTFLNDSGYVDWKGFTYQNGNSALSNLLRYHILNGNQRASELSNATYLSLYSGHYVEIMKDNSGTVKLKDETGMEPYAAIKTTDITAVNGSIHIIDKVLQHN